jgi:hypothetical protein
METNKEYWMIYRGPGFLAVVWFGSSTMHPLSRQKFVSLSQSSCVSPVELTDGRGGLEGVGEEPNYKKKSNPLYIIQ